MMKIIEADKFREWLLKAAEVAKEETNKALDDGDYGEAYECKTIAEVIGTFVEMIDNPKLYEVDFIKEV